MNPTAALLSPLFSIGWQFEKWPNTPFYSVMNIATGAFIFAYILGAFDTEESE